MFEGLAATIEELTIPVDARALAEVLTLIDRLTAKATEALAEFDRAGLWDADASTSLTAWLADRAGMTRSGAARTAARARRVAALPVTAEAWRSGELSGGQVDAIVAAVDDQTVDTFARHEAELVPTLAGLTTRDTMRALAVWKAHATADGTQPEYAVRAVHLSRTLDGTGVLDGSLSPEGYAVVKTALRVAASPDVEGEPARTPAQRRHDALIDVFRSFLDHQTTQTGARHRPHLNVVVDLAHLETNRGGQIIDGPRLDGPTISRLLCDSALHRVLTAGRSSILDYGTSTRTIPVNLWNAVVIRDEGCRFPGCDRPPEWCEAHHLQWVTHGGPTALDNLALLCSRHHHRLHQPGWHAKLKPDGSLEVTDPSGVVRTSHPPGALPAVA